jgi:hypothetical protein
MLEQAPRCRSISPLRPLLAAGLLCLASCANLSVTQTGFLDDYDTLAEAPDHEVTFIPDEIELFQVDDLAERGYDAVLIEPAVYRPTADPRVGLEPEEIDELRADFDATLRETLGERFEIVEQPRPGAVRVRAAITDVATSNVPINVVMVILLVPTDMGGISGELELRDAMTDERLLAMSAYREGTPFLILECFSRFGHARHGMLKWSRKLRDLLTPASANS